MHVNWYKGREHCALKTAKQVNTYRNANRKWERILSNTELSLVNYKVEWWTALGKKLLPISKHSHQVKPRDILFRVCTLYLSEHALYLFMGLESLEFCCSSFFLFLLMSLNLHHDGLSHSNLVYRHLIRKMGSNKKKRLKFCSHITKLKFSIQSMVTLWIMDRIGLSPT